MTSIERATADAKITAAPIEPGASGSKGLAAYLAKGFCTTACIEPGASGSILPEFGRVPDVERLFGVKRGLTYRAIKNGDIKSLVIREKGKKTGARLIHLASVRDWLNAQLG